MIDRDLIERSATYFSPPPDAFERLIRRRERRQRNQRLAAAAVGIAVLLVGLFTGYEVLRSAEPAPREPTPVPTVSVVPTTPPEPTASATAAIHDSVSFLDLGSGVLTPLPHAIQEMSPQRVIASPDGSTLAVEALEGGDRTQIFLAALDGTSIRRLTDDPDGARLGGWSPDGSRIVYTTAALFEEKVIRVVEAATGTTSDVFADPDYVGHPVFSPDGERILFTWARDVADAKWVTKWRTDLWVIPAGGATPTRLIEHGGYGSYTPDGTQIVYRRTLPQPDAFCGMCWWVGLGNSVVRSDGSEQPGATEGGMVAPPSVFDKVQPRFSPDGTRFLQSRPSDRVGEFWIVDAESGARTSIGSAVFAAWLDDETLIVIDFSEAVP